MCDRDYIANCDAIPIKLCPVMEKKFPEFSLRKLKNSMRSTFPLMRLLGSQEVVLTHCYTANCYCMERCVIFTKATITSQSMETMGRMAQDPQTNQTGENLSLLGHYHKFPEFSLSFCVLTKFPEFSLTGKLETPFQGFP